MHAWHNQQLASQHSFYNADDLQEYNIAGRIHSNREGDLARVDFNNDTISTETGRDVSTLGSQELKTLVSEQVCTCATCLDWYPSGSYSLPKGHRNWSFPTFACRVTGCQWTTKEDVDDLNMLHKLLKHESYWGRQDHYGKPGDYRCREVGCKFVTKRWTDFKRHSSSKHCIKPTNFECPVLGCKYHHIGFSRKDKLKSHVDNVHKGYSQPGKPNQAIKPKVTVGA
ncbi:MAG: hypothetical protein Q9175_000182 [Cornicularia normoerica]